MAAAREEKQGTAAAGGTGGLVAWAEGSRRWRAGGPARGGLRFAFYGRVSTEDWQDPVTSRARQREQAEALVRGHGVIVAEFFDAGHSRMVAWGRRPEAAALVDLLADPGRGWNAIVVGKYERASYGSQYAAMAPLFEHYGVQLWMPEAGGRVDYASASSTGSTPNSRRYQGRLRSRSVTVTATWVMAGNSAITPPTRSDHTLLSGSSLCWATSAPSTPRYPPIARVLGVQNAGPQVRDRARAGPRLAGQEPDDTL